MDHSPTFQDIEAFVREFAGLRPKHVLAPQTRLEADLGITGDDGDDLLQQASSRFGAKLAHPLHGYRATFSLAEDEYLFHGEGVDLLGIGALLRWLHIEPRPRVRDLTVGELYDAILRNLSNGALPNTSLERTRER